MLMILPGPSDAVLISAPFLPPLSLPSPNSTLRLLWLSAWTAVQRKLLLTWTAPCFCSPSPPQCPTIPWFNHPLQPFLSQKRPPAQLLKTLPNTTPNTPTTTRKLRHTSSCSRRGVRPRTRPQSSDDPPPPRTCATWPWALPASCRLQGTSDETSWATIGPRSPVVRRNHPESSLCH